MNSDVQQPHPQSAIELTLRRNYQGILDSSFPITRLNIMFKCNIVNPAIVLTLRHNYQGILVSSLMPPFREDCVIAFTYTPCRTIIRDS